MQPASPMQFSPSYAARVSEQLTELKLQAKSPTDYAKAITQLISLLKTTAQHDQEKLAQVLEQFNQAFTQVDLSILSKPTSEILESSLDKDLIKEISALIEKEKTATQPDQFKINLLSLISYVCNKMNEQYLKNSLPYHQHRHALEMFFDLFTLLKQEELKPLKILVMLCGLFHDVIFTHSRIADETASADEMLQVLAPVFKLLSTENQIIIKDIATIIILGGTTPCFLNSDTTIVNATDLAASILQAEDSLVTRRPLFNLMRKLSSLIQDADINRTEIKALDSEVEYTSEYWDILKKFYASVPAKDIPMLQRKLTQNMRVMLEMNLYKSKDDPLASYTLQNQKTAVTSPELKLSEEYLAEIVNQIGGEKNSYSEILFAQRMINTEQSQLRTKTVKHAKLWKMHQDVLKSIHSFLTSEAATEEKTKVVRALGMVANDQDGKLNDCSKILAVISELSLQLPTPTPKSSTCCSFL